MLILAFTITLAGCSSDDSGGSVTTDTPVSPENDGKVSALLIKIDGKEMGYLSGDADIRALSELLKQEKLE